MCESFLSALFLLHCIETGISDRKIRPPIDPVCTLFFTVKSLLVAGTSSAPLLDRWMSHHNSPKSRGIRDELKTSTFSVFSYFRKKVNLGF